MRRACRKPEKPLLGLSTPKPNCGGLEIAWPAPLPWPRRHWPLSPASGHAQGRVDEAGQEPGLLIVEPVEAHVAGLGAIDDGHHHAQLDLVDAGEAKVVDDRDAIAELPARGLVADDRAGAAAPAVETAGCRRRVPPPNPDRRRGSPNRPRAGIAAEDAVGQVEDDVDLLDFKNDAGQDDRAGEDEVVVGPAG